MQKKNLHLFLLLLLIGGCARQPLDIRNPYIFNNKDFKVVSAASKQAILRYGLLETEIGSSLPVVFVQLIPALPRFQHWEVRWESPRQEPLDLPRGSFLRSLCSLSAQDTTAGLALQVIALPAGNGVSIFLHGRSVDHFNLRLAANSAEPYLTRSPQRLTKQTIVFQAADGTALAVGVAGGIAQVVRDNPGSLAGAWRLTLESSARRQVVLAVGDSNSAAQAAVESLLDKSPEEVEAQTRAELAGRLAFTVNTADERFNKAFAILAAELAGGAARLPLGARAEIELASQAATGFYLAARQRPETVFPPSGDSPVQFTPQQERDFLRWGGAAHLAALRYGMASPDSLRILSLYILAELSRLQGEYFENDLAVLVDSAAGDSAARLAAAHVRLAGLMTLGEYIAMARGDPAAQNDFRAEALRAGRRCREINGRILREYRKAAKLQQQDDQLTDPFTDTVTTAASEPARMIPPDTLRLLQAGARYGFDWLGNDAVRWWSPAISTDGFLWQRWVAHLFAVNPTLQHSPDLDSLLTLVLSGPAVGQIGLAAAGDAPPSVTAAAALQNIAEVYLGVRPDAFRGRVDIEPHLPPEWGPTTARIPFAGGALYVHYDLAGEIAYVGMSDIESDLKVFMGYPLSDGGFARTQFILTPAEPVQRIKQIREAGNRWRLSVDTAPKRTFAYK